MIISEAFAFPHKENLFKKVEYILRNEFGLIDGKEENFKDKNFRVLVWEDEKGIGRYRVHCKKGSQHPLFRDNEKLDLFTFHYWATSKFDKEILLKNPMKDPLEKIKSLSENRYNIEHLYCEKTIEELERIALSENPMKDRDKYRPKL